VAYTLGFVDAQELAEHFEKHVTIRQEFVVQFEIEYQALADTFLGSPLDVDTHECNRRRRDGSNDRIRYNKITQEYGILSARKVIRSYYIADPLEHGWPSNYDYWQWDCNRLRG
jgi:hypothetical protein